MPNLDEFPPLSSQLSSSAPAVPVWPADVGEGTWALPNQAILPEDSRPRPTLPEVPSLWHVPAAHSNATAGFGWAIAER